MRVAPADEKRVPCRAACRGALLLLTVTLAAVWPSTGNATRVRALNLEQLTRKAARIFSGYCTAVEVVHDAALDRDVTVVTIQVSRVLKGPSAAEVTFRVLGADGARSIVGQPRFRRDEELILFLYGESGSGLSSPVGLGQGKFVTLRDTKGQAVTVNGFGNRILFHGLSDEAASRLGDAPRVWRDEGGLPPDVLLQLIEDLEP